MGKAGVNVLEFRALIKPEWTELYVLIEIVGDFDPSLGGWYKKVIPKTEPALPALERAMSKMEYFNWDRGAIAPQDATPRAAPIHHEVVPGRGWVPPGDPEHPDTPQLEATDDERAEASIHDIADEHARSVKQMFADRDYVLPNMYLGLIATDMRLLAERIDNRRRRIESMRHVIDSAIKEHEERQPAQGEADEAVSGAYEDLIHEIRVNGMSEESEDRLRHALASRQQCPYVVTSRGGTSHCSLAEQWSSQRVPDEIRRLPDEWESTAQRIENEPHTGADRRVIDSIRCLVKELRCAIAKSGDDHE